MPVKSLTDVLRAEACGQDLYQDTEGNVQIRAMRKDGSLYRIGHVTTAFLAQCPEAARHAIDMIKFNFGNPGHYIR